MIKRSVILLGLALELTAPLGMAAEVPTDEIIRREIIGSWIVPSDSADHTPDTDRTLETFRPDGTYTFAVYKDPGCRLLAQKIDVKWSVNNHVLITTAPGGGALSDEIVYIDSGKLVLHSLDDGTTYTRIRRDSCASARP